MVEEFHPAVGNRKDGEWDHLCEEPEQSRQGRLIRAVMKSEWRQRKREVPNNAERCDREGDRCDDVISAECIYDESGKEGQDRNKEEGRQCFDEC